jgi:methionyl-tRNA formyltransferase
MSEGKGTTGSKLRVVLLTHGGAERALEQLLALHSVEVAGVFVETPAPRRRTLREKIKRSVRYDGVGGTLAKPLLKVRDRLARRGGEGAVADEHAKLRSLAESRGVPIHFVDDYHAPASLELIRAARPDLGVVYGTNILKEPVFSIPRLGSINLHQGRVPFYRGGPPVFWELFNGEPEVGITVHTVAAKVDAGEVIIQDTVPLEYDYAHGLDFDAFIADFRARRMLDASARLLAEAVRLVAEGRAEPRAQDLSLGRRYRLPTKREKDELRRRLRARRSETEARGIGARGAEGGAR